MKMEAQSSFLSVVFLLFCNIDGGESPEEQSDRRNTSVCHKMQPQHMYDHKQYVQIILTIKPYMFRLIAIFSVSSNADLRY